MSVADHSMNELFVKFYPNENALVFTVFRYFGASCMIDRNLKTEQSALKCKMWFKRSSTEVLAFHYADTCSAVTCGEI